MVISFRYFLACALFDSGPLCRNCGICCGQKCKKYVFFGFWRTGTHIGKCGILVFPVLLCFFRVIPRFFLFTFFPDFSCFSRVFPVPSATFCHCVSYIASICGSQQHILDIMIVIQYVTKGGSFLFGIFSPLSLEKMNCYRLFYPGKFLNCHTGNSFSQITLQSIQNMNFMCFMLK